MRKRNLLGRWTLPLLVLPWLVGCASISPPSSPQVRRYDELARQNHSPAAETQPAVFCTASYILGNSPSQRLSQMLATRLQERLQALGLREVNSAEEADLTVDCTVRSWWGRPGVSVALSALTSTVYTPLWYPWLIQVNIRDRSGQPVGDAYLHGRVLWHCWVVLFFPTTIAQHIAVLDRQWYQLTDEAARMAAATVADRNSAKAK